MPPLGAIGASQKLVSGLVRINKLEIEAPYGVTVIPEHVLWLWAVELSGVQIDRLLVRANGRTASNPVISVPCDTVMQAPQ